MSNSVDTLMRILRKDEYDNAENNEKVLNESVNELYKGFKDDINKKAFTAKKLQYECALAKEVICECMSNIYISSLVIDEPERYSDSLRSGMREQCMSIMENATSVSELEAMFENASPYIKAMFPLIESIIDTKTENDVKEFNTSVFLTNDDKKLINEFEKYEGKDSYAEELQDRIIDVYKKEQELGQERNEKVQNVVDELAKIEEKRAEEKAKELGEPDSNPITESIEKGMGMFSNVPQTLFNSIFVNKSKMIINEAGTGADLTSNAEEILAETICTYTLLECINSLGLKTFTDEEKTRMRYEFFTA